MSVLIDLERNHSGLGISFLYKGAMSLVANATKYLSEKGRLDQEALPNRLQKLYEIESMYLTTRLMHLASWFLFVRALNSGEMSAKKVWSETKKIDLSVTSLTKNNLELSRALPPIFFQFIQESLCLEERVRRLDKDIRDSMINESVICFKNSVSEQRRLLETSFSGIRL